MMHTPGTFANLVELNPTVSMLYCIAHRLCPRSQVTTINEYCSQFRSVSTWSHDPRAPHLHMSSAESLRFGSELKLFEDMRALLGPKVLVVHQAFDLEFLLNLLDNFSPDLIITNRPELLDLVPALRLQEKSLTRICESLPRWLNETQLILIGNKSSFGLFLESASAIISLIDRLRQSNTHTFDLHNLFPRVGFLPLESHSGWSWAWTGPLNSSSFYVPILSSEKTRVTIFFFSSKVKFDHFNIEVRVDGKIMMPSFYLKDLKLELFHVAQTNAAFMRIELRVLAPVVIEDYSKRIGLALHRVKLEVLE